MDPGLPVKQYLDGLIACCKTHNFPRPPGVILEDHDFQALKNLMLPLCPYDMAMQMLSGNEMKYRSLILRPKTEIFPPTD